MECAGAVAVVLEVERAVVWHRGEYLRVVRAERYVSELAYVNGVELALVHVGVVDALLREESAPEQPGALQLLLCAHLYVALVYHLVLGRQRAREHLVLLLGLLGLCAQRGYRGPQLAYALVLVAQVAPERLYGGVFLGELAVQEIDDAPHLLHVLPAAPLERVLELRYLAALALQHPAEVLQVLPDLLFRQQHSVLGLVGQQHILLGGYAVQPRGDGRHDGRQLAEFSFFLLVVSDDGVALGNIRRDVNALVAARQCEAGSAGDNQRQACCSECFHKSLVV